VLDALEPSPALIRTATWNVVASNRAATVVLTDYGALPPEERNILRFISGVVARFIVCLLSGFVSCPVAGRA
jgi:hypothetical protein